MTVDTSQAAIALLTEHLQWTPLSVIDDIINTVNSIIYAGIQQTEDALFRTAPETLGFKAATTTAEGGPQAEPEYPEAKAEIEEGLHKLETLLGSTVDKNFDKFEIYVLRNILSLPEDLASLVRLSHYENLSYPLPSDAPTAESVQMLRKKVAASQNLSSAIAAEQARNETILSQLRGLSSTVANTISTNESATAHPNFSFLTNTPTAVALGASSADGSHQPLTTNTTFTLSQLPALQTVLAELRPKLVSLHATELGSSGAKDEIREERIGYLERRTKAHLDRNRIARAENAGVVSGRRIEKDDVEALEKAASMFDPS